MRQAISILKWVFLFLGLALVALGAGTRLFGIPDEIIQPVSAAISPEEPPWDEFDPFLVSTSLPDAPSMTNLPDAYQAIITQAEPAVFGSEQEPLFAPERLVIPSIDLEAPVVKTGSKKYNIRGLVYEQWIVPDLFAAGWNPNSAYPGHPGNTVLFGHHNVNGAVFARLVDLKSDEPISVFAGGYEFKYRVREVLKVKEKDVSFDQMVENAQWIGRTEDERLTLVTCWPPYESTYRLIVVADPVQ